MTLQDKYINPFTDFGFKKLFGTEPNKDLLIDFLNQVLPAHHQIQDLSYTPTEQLGNTEFDRKAIFDLYCTSPSGERFIVEVQKAKQNFFKDCSVFYATFPIQEQAKKGEWDYSLSAVYTVGILDFIFEEDKYLDQVRHEVKLRDEHCGVFHDKLTFIYLEMPKFKKTEAELVTPFDKWMYVLRHLPNLQSRPTALQERVFEKLFAAAEIARFSREELAGYESSLKYYRDMKNVIDTGIREGFEKGKQEGLQDGRLERETEIIVQSFKAGFDLEIISQITGKAIHEIEIILKKYLEK